MSTVSAGPDVERARRVRMWVNWTLALLTLAGAAVVRIFALGAVMSTAGCSTVECPDMGPSGFWFAVFYYGPLVVVAATLLLSFVTAPRKHGIAVPLVAWALLAADLAALAITFNS